MTSNEIADLLAALRAGRFSADEVAVRFRERSWTVTRRPVAATYQEMAERQDPPADVPGSFDEVTAAYDREEITWEQYRTLAHAVADSINAEALRQQAGEAAD
jgi:hypothetical protein